MTHGRPPHLELWELCGTCLRWKLSIQESEYILGLQGTLK